MTCHVCETPNDSRYFFCFECNLKKNRGEIVECSVCGHWRLRSKYDERCCPDCFVNMKNNKGEQLPSDPYAVYRVKNDPSNTHIDGTTVTKELIEIHKKHKHQYNNDKNFFKKIRRLNDSIKKRELKTQKFCSSWSDNKYL